MKLSQLNERSKTTPMKNANGDKVMISYSDGQFWFGDNGEKESTPLGSTIKAAKAKLKDITNNSNFITIYKSAIEKKDVTVIQRSIDRHFKKLQDKETEEFDFLKFLEMNESIDDVRKVLSKMG